MAAAKRTTHATEQSSVALHASLAATDDAINHNVGGNVDASASMPITRQLLANLLRSNSRSMHGQPNHADAETTIDAPEQLTAATDRILTATEHATSRNAAEQSAEDTRPRQRNKGNKLRRMRHEHDDSVREQRPRKQLLLSITPLVSNDP